MVADGTLVQDSGCAGRRGHRTNRVNKVPDGLRRPVHLLSRASIAALVVACVAAPVASPLAPSAAAAPAAGTNCTDGGGNVYFFVNSLRNGPADRVVVYGKSCDQVLVGDWDGDGVDTLAVRRGNRYYFKNSVSGGNADQVIAYGRATDQVLIGDWDGDRTDTVAVRRSAIYYVKDTLAAGTADATFTFGRAQDYAMVGDWDGDGRHTLAVRRTAGAMPATAGGQLDILKAPGNISDYVSSGAATQVGFAVGAADELGTGWASNAVNAMPFRHSSVATTIRDGDEIQTTADGAHRNSPELLIGIPQVAWSG